MCQFLNLLPNILVHSCILDNLFRQATFLDPLFGPTCFDSYTRSQVIDLIKAIFDKDLINLSLKKK